MDVNFLLLRGVKLSKFTLGNNDRVIINSRIFLKIIFPVIMGV